MSNVVNEDSTALVSFRTKNVRSYKSEAEMTFDALRVGNEDVVQVIKTKAAKPLRVLPVVGIYGANASGKTAFLKAMADMRSVVLRSFMRKDREYSLRRPFLLGAIDSSTNSLPSEFSIELVLDGVRWQYGFTVNDEEVLYEFAYNYPLGRPKLVFDRDKDDIQVGDQFKRLFRTIASLIRPESLLLSIVGVLPESASIREIDDSSICALHEWFDDNFRLITADNRSPRVRHTAELARNGPTRVRVLEFLKAADLGITDLITEEVEEDEFIEKLKQAFSIVQSDQEDDKLEVAEVVKLEHRGLNENLVFEPDDESTGTQVWVGLVAPAIEALDGGHVLLVDELDTSLHPHLVKLFVEIFQDPALNPRCAQMVFNAHDTDLLNEKDRFSLGRDQIWFTEKSEGGETRIFPLTDFKGRREDLVGKRYLAGRFGAVPFLSYNPVTQSEEYVH